MRTDREALIAGIAADPHNDLRKLVFADWLEEHGEPERAEFIRLAIGNKRADTRTKAAEKRAKTLFTKHWRKWFGPFLEALDPGRGADGFELVPERAFHFRLASSSFPLLPYPLDGGLGLLTGLWLNLEAVPQGSSLDRALRLEPVWGVAVSLAREPRWKQVTGPSLDQISYLSIAGIADARRGETPLDVPPILNDKHLTGVTTCTFAIRQPNGSPHRVLEAFVASRLARQVRNLQLLDVDARDFRHLSESRRLKLEYLHVNTDTPTPRPIGELLASAGFATTLKTLNIQVGGNTATKRVSPMFSALCEGTRWKGLADLHLHIQEGYVGVAKAGLRALAKASFLPQLEMLHIPLDNEPDPKLITAIVEQLDPARVRRLLFEKRGDVSMPECFVRKFGDRAREGVDEEHGNAYWQVLPLAGA